jgi:hypothetical protein
MMRQAQQAGARQARQQAAKGTSAVFGYPPGTQPLASSFLLPPGAEVRFLDVLITIVVSAITVIWTSTRPSTQALGWSVFWLVLGAMMAVEGRGELRYGGFGVAASNATYLTLRVMQFVKVVQPQQSQTKAGLVQVPAQATWM